MEFLPADYVLCAFAVFVSVTGLFRGFSGSLAFLAASGAAGSVAAFGWPWSENVTGVMWQRAGGVFIVSLLTFGLVRVIVKKTVNGLLAQPSDALFGFLTGALTAALVVFAWAYSGIYLEYSNLASYVAEVAFGG